MTTTPTKQCNRCRNVYPANEQYFHRSKKGDGWRHMCKACVSAMYHAAKDRPVVRPSHKACIECHRMLPCDEKHFRPHAMMRDGLKNLCKECQHERECSRRQARKAAEKQEVAETVCAAPLYADSDLPALDAAYAALYATLARRKRERFEAARKASSCP